MTAIRCIRHFLLLTLLATGLLLFPHQAHANVSCGINSAPSINFGTVDGLTSGATASSPVTWTCQNTDGTAAYVTFCLNIGSGTGGTQGTARLMNAGTGQNLQFQLYTNTGHTQVWGSLLNAVNPLPYQVQFIVPAAVLLFPGTYNGNATVYGAIPNGQTGISAGNYTSSFSGNDAAVTGTYSEGSTTYPTTCGTTTAGSFPFTVSATVSKSCTVSATTLDFGTPTGLLTTNVDATTTITTNCTKNLAYQIGLDNGQNASGTIRRMVGTSGDLVAYQLYSDSGRSLGWGNTPGTDTVGATGSGSAQTTTVYGRVAPQNTPTPGTYNDTVTVYVYY